MSENSLTTREDQVLRFIASGLSYKEVAGELGVSVNTVRNHAAAIRQKLGVHSMVQAVGRWQQLRTPMDRMRP